MVLRLFGLEVQVPCPPEDGDKSAAGRGKQKSQQRPPPKVWGHWLVEATMLG